MSDDIWSRLDDLVAAELERSPISGETRQKIKAVFEEATKSAGPAGVPSADFASRIVDELSPEELKEIVTEWLQSKTAL